MQSETGFPSSHQLKSYVASKSRLKLAARAVLSADAGLLVRIHVVVKHLTIYQLTECRHPSATTESVVVFSGNCIRQCRM